MKRVAHGDQTRNLLKMDVLNIYVVKKLFLETHAREKVE
jgi:hypothetical protein